MHSQLGDDPAAIRHMWGLGPPTNRGPQARLSLEEIVGTALGLADRIGIRAVTLAAIAKELDLATTGLYRYVDSKDTLDELVVDAALGPPPRCRGGSPVKRIDSWIDALWGRYQQHAWLAEVSIRRAPRCPHAYAWLGVLVTELQLLGDPSPVGTAVTLDILVRGYAELEIASAASRLSEVVAQELHRRHPNLVSSGQPTVDPRAELRRVVPKVLTFPQG